MSGFFDLCEKYFKTRNIYEVLGIPKDASDSQVRKAYHKASLKVHPDRVDAAEKTECTEKFKIIGKIHSILSDSDKRALYDETGDIGEDDFSERNWTKYWRLLFKKITLQDIKNFETKYKGSKEELEDLRKAYLEGEGEMDYILETVLCATLDDEPRLRELLQNMIDDEEIPAYAKFTNESKSKKKRRKRKVEKEAEEAEEMKEELGLGDKESDLFALIRKKQTNREQEMNSFYDSLAEKYGGKNKTSKTKGKGKRN
ncbi:dnaJ homolog subfamily C member 9-like [Ischnura elegans]|uniref:dnaJ homolog subfamily C member 9-like n=1 Tax=Ischnura elegans TaxID=197161 RepID=UPI001ED89979|nr:dnaJ homolog subfamily C member 9-like [Ischnura elegans]XP_046398164.1 dnaJ homolog subfamily C member 9-like [Ischnura elegans]